MNGMPYGLWSLGFCLVSQIKCWATFRGLPAYLPQWALKRAVWKLSFHLCQLVHHAVLTLNRLTLGIHSRALGARPVPLPRSSGSISWKLANIADAFLSHISMHVIQIRLHWPWRQYVFPKRLMLMYYTVQTPKTRPASALNTRKFIQMNRNWSSAILVRRCSVIVKQCYEGVAPKGVGGEHDRVWLSCCRDTGLSTQTSSTFAVNRQVLLLLLLLRGKVVDFSSLNSVQLPVFQHVFQCGLSACCVVKLAAILDRGLTSSAPGALVFFQ